MNAANEQGRTSLWKASSRGDTESVKALLRAGANVNTADKIGMTPLRAATWRGHTEVVKVLLRAPGIDVNKADKDGVTPLRAATWRGHTEVVKVLLRAPGIDVNKADKDGQSPLHAASEFGHTEVVKVLLAAPGIDVNQADKDGWTPLRGASWDGHTEVVKVLLRAPGIDVNKADRNGVTPLRAATWRGHTEVVKVLLRAPGIDVNKADRNGRTPLHQASYQDHTEVVKLLLAKGADPSKRDIEGKTALDLARLREIRILLGDDTEILLKRAIVKGMKNGKNATFTEPILYADYRYRDLKPVNQNAPHINSFGLVIDDKKNPMYILELEGARRAMRNVRERRRVGMRVNHPLPGIIFKNWSLVNFTRNEYLKAVKDLQKLSALAKSARTRKAPKSTNIGNLVARMNRMNVASPSRAPNNLVSLKLQAKRLRIRVTNNVHGKRVPKSANKLRTQIQNALARKARR